MSIEAYENVNRGLTIRIFSATCYEQKVPVYADKDMSRY